MQIKVNGEIKEYQDSLTLDELINNLVL